MAKGKQKKHEAFWTSIVLVVLGMVMVVNILRDTVPDVTPAALFALLIGIGFIIAGYGLWVTKKWGAILGITLCCLKLAQLEYYSGEFFFNRPTLTAFAAYTGIILFISAHGWGKLKT